MSETNSQPVTLPAGSYDYDELKKGLDKAAKGAAKNYGANVADAVDAASSKAFETVDPRNTPGYKLQEVEHAELGIRETIQVYDPKKEDEAVEAQAEGALPAAKPSNKPEASDGAAAGKE